VASITESNIYALWVAAQSAKGTGSSDTVAKRVIHVSGDIDLNREDGSENYSDLDRFGQATDYINNVSGKGAPGIQAQPNTVAFLCWLFFGGETFTAKVAGTSAPKYVFVPGANTGFWSTWWKRVGQSQIIRQKFVDSKITSLKIEGSTGQKVVRITPTFTSLDPGITYATDPTGGLSSITPLLYTDATGTITIDGTVFQSTTQVSVTIDDASTPVQGDGTRFYDLVPGNAQITMEGPTILLDSDSIGRYNTIVYGTASPSAGTKPLTSKPMTGSFSCEWSRGTGDARESLKIEIPAVHWTPDLAIAPNPDGGPIELALNGSMRKKSDGSKAITITVETGAGDNAAHTLPS
jgi:hypothetical protein